MSLSTATTMLLRSSSSSLSSCRNRLFRHCPALSFLTPLAASPPHRQQLLQNSSTAYFATKTKPVTTGTTTTTTPTTVKSTGSVLRMDTLVKAVAEAHKLSAAKSRRIIDTIVDTISDVSNKQ
jgi:hypothetical protein